MFNHFNNQIENLRQSVIKYNQTLDWITVTNSDLQDFWTNNIQVEYAKDSLGFVHIRGTIVNVSVSNLSLLFTLPSQYKPSQNTAITATVRNISKTTYLAGEIEINSITGDIIFRNDGSCI